MENLSELEWAYCIAELTFDLLHPEDTLTLRTVGLFVDPLSPRAPLHFRILFSLKKALLTADAGGHPLSKNIMRHIEAMINIDGCKVYDVLC